MRTHSHIGAHIRVVIAISAMFAAACSDHPTTNTVGDSKSQLRQPVLTRDNPLETYIRANWTNGNTTATGGSHYPNIKLYGHSYAAVPQTDADFIAQHFDMYMWGSSLVGAAAASLNPTMVWLFEAANIPCIRTGWDYNEAVSWMNNSTKNPNGYDWDDLLLYYRVNTTTWVGSTPGWNPSDDTDGDGCIEPGEGNNGQPSDPNRTAMCRWDARVLFQNGWMLANVAGPAYKDFRADMAKDAWTNHGVDGFHFDEAAYEPASLQLGNTFTYEGWSDTDPNLPYIFDKIMFTQAVMADAEAFIGAPTVAVANMVSGYYACNDSKPQVRDAAKLYLENLLLETQIPVGFSPPTTLYRSRYLDSPYVDYLLEHKGVMITGRDAAGSERGKLFSLGMFYLINHQMAFYYYAENGHSGVDCEATQWNPWVAYNVGQPAANNLGLSDFQGNSGTDRFFVFGSGATYQLLGRQYLRSDNKRVFVLVKLMAYGQSEGLNSVVHALGGNYRKVLSDFTLGPVISSVTLANNDAVILVKEPPGGCRDCDPEG